MCNQQHFIQIKSKEIHTKMFFFSFIQRTLLIHHYWKYIIIFTSFLLFYLIFYFAIFHIFNKHCTMYIRISYIWHIYAHFQFYSYVQQYIIQFQFQHTWSKLRRITNNIQQLIHAIIMRYT